MAAAISRRATFTRAGVAGLGLLGLTGCRKSDSSATQTSSATTSTQSFATSAGASATPSSSTAALQLRSQDDTVRAFEGQRPQYWGFAAPGVHTRFSTQTAAGANAVCLTFDACGGLATKFDSALIANLRSMRVPATLFINRVWAANNQSLFQQLLDDPLFEIENHGDRHVPLSVTGRAAYGIKGTSDVGAAWREIAGCYSYMSDRFNHRPRYMRPGTAYSDDVAARAAVFMGQPIVNFSINGDAGATASAATVASEVSRARAGDIVLCHMNHPGSGTAAGIAKAVPALRAQGIAFRRVSEVL